MVELDQRAFEAAWQAMKRCVNAGVELIKEGSSPPIKEDLRKSIEAYEAAKWWPIEEAPRDGRDILIHWPKDGPSALSGSWLTRWSHEGCWGHGEGALMPNSPLLKGAMFRTIDPPKQDAISRATSTPPAAEASS